MLEWKLILRYGFGNVFPRGRWDLDGVDLIAQAVNDGDWSLVIEYAEIVEFNWETAD